MLGAFNEMSRQEKMDRTMCRPGYRWNETIGRCLPPPGAAESEPGETPDGAVAQEKVKRVNGAAAKPVK